MKENCCNGVRFVHRMHPMRWFFLWAVVVDSCCFLLFHFCLAERISTKLRDENFFFFFCYVFWCLESARIWICYKFDSFVTIQVRQSSIFATNNYIFSNAFKCHHEIIWKCTQLFVTYIFNIITNLTDSIVVPFTCV